MFDVMMTDGRATYGVEAVPADHAEAVGCPGADSRLIGRHGCIYGFFTATGKVPGRAVRVPGWHTRRGVRVTFVPWLVDAGANGSLPVEGWAD